MHNNILCCQENREMYIVINMAIMISHTFVHSLSSFRLFSTCPHEPHGTGFPSPLPTHLLLFIFHNTYYSLTIYHIGFLLTHVPHETMSSQKADKSRHWRYSQRTR